MSWQCALLHMGYLSDKASCVPDLEFLCTSWGRDLVSVCRGEGRRWRKRTRLRIQGQGGEFLVTNIQDTSFMEKGRGNCSDPELLIFRSWVTASRVDEKADISMTEPPCSVDCRCPQRTALIWWKQNGESQPSA